MSTHNRIKSLTAAALLAACGMASQAAHAADSAICYNCPPEWADWGTQLKAIARDTGIQVPQDNKNSGQALAQMVAEQGNPVADVVYYGVSFGIQAAGAGVIADYKPAHWDEVPTGMKDPDGKWVALHSGTMGFMVNVAPGLSWFKKLQANQPIVPKQTAYARLISGEIPILLDYDFNAYRAKYKDHANVAFVIPQEGTVTVPYVMSLVKNAPHAANGKKVIDYVLSDKGQAIWANAYLRPVRPSAMSAEAKAKFLPDSDYARATTVDYQQMADAQKAFSARYLSEIR